MAEIKSAQEIAREKIAKLGEATPEEILSWKYVPEGEKLAARYLKDDVNLTTELSQYQDENIRKHVTKGAEEVLIRNISLPRNDAAKKENRRIMEALKALKHDKVAAENVFSKMRRIFSHYVGPGEEQRKEAYEQLKIDFTAKLRQAMQQQGLGMNARINIEQQPEFQAEWRRMSSRLEGQYQEHLEEYKKELSAVV
ncbi:MAG: hypothetical protein ABIB93_05835 [Chloroflexota bacterium]